MVTLPDGLEAAGLTVRWARNKDAEPGRGAPPDVVVLDGDAFAGGFGELIKRWRAIDPAPALVLVGGGPAAKAARDHGLPHAPKPLDGTGLGQALARAAEGRFVGALTPAAALRGLGLAPSGDARQDAVLIASHSRKVDLSLVRDALRPFADAYVTIGPALAVLRENRALTIPETNLAMSLDGTRTLRKIAESGVLDPQATLRCVWALASSGVCKLTSEPIETAGPAASFLALVRRRFTARGETVAKARTHYDLLDIVPDPDLKPQDVEAAGQALAIWYAPDRVQGLDLGPLGSVVEPYWQHVIKAVQTLRDPPTCRRYYFWLIEQGINVDQVSQAGKAAMRDGESLFAAGQAALAQGDVFRAVSQLAQAARIKPDEPDYEAYAAWARYMADVARGGDGRPALARELVAVERALLGRRPRGRALYCMGLMAQVAGDLDTARMHLNDALHVDPSLAAAQRALARIARSGRATTLVTEVKPE
jgi:hypothetical protein